MKATLGEWEIQKNPRERDPRQRGQGPKSLHGEPSLDSIGNPLNHSGCFFLGFNLFLSFFLSPRAFILKSDWTIKDF